MVNERALKIFSYLQRQKVNTPITIVPEHFGLSPLNFCLEEILSCIAVKWSGMS